MPSPSPTCARAHEGFFPALMGATPRSLDIALRLGPIFAKEKRMADACCSPILLATLVAGTLDILSAFVFAGLAGATPAACCATSPPARSATRRDGGAGWAAVGLAVHFALMALHGGGLHRRRAAHPGAAARSPILCRACSTASLPMS